MHTILLYSAPPQPLTFFLTRSTRRWQRRARLAQQPEPSRSDASLALGKSFFFPIPSMRSVVFHWTRRHGNWPCGGARGDCARLEELADVGPSSQRDTHYASSYFLLQCAPQSLFFFLPFCWPLCSSSLRNFLSLFIKRRVVFHLGGWGGLCGKFSFSTFSSLAAGNLFISLGASPVARTTHSFADQCRLPHNWCKSADPHFRHSF